MVSREKDALYVYVAGPIHGSGTQAQNVSLAIEAADQIADAGMFPFVPHLYMPWEMKMNRDDQEWWLKQCFGWLRRCDILVRLPGGSPGSEREQTLASKLKMPIYTGAWPVNDLIRDFEDGKHYRGGLMDRTFGIKPPPLTLDSLQSQVHEWLKKQPFFRDQPLHQPLLGIGEEAGELMHAHLKMEQGIRGSAEKHIADARDAIGDLLVYTAGYCIARDWDMGECVQGALDVVLKRDWSKNPTDGVSK